MRRACFFLGLLGCGLWYLLSGSFLGWVLLLSMLALPGLSLLLSLPALLGFQMAPAGPDRLMPGETGTFLLLGSCNAPMVPFRGRLRFRNLRTGKVTNYDESTGFCPPCSGGWEIYLAKCRVSDYLGLFTLPVRHQGRQRLLVLPRPQPVEDLPDLGTGPGIRWKPSQSPFGENHELRSYRPGDGLNTVHWKLTAKTGELTVREAQEPVRPLACLCLSLYGTDEEADRVLGQLLWLGEFLLDRGLSLEIRAAEDQGIRVLRAADKDALRAALETLLTLQAPASATPPEPGAASWRVTLGGSL